MIFNELDEIIQQEIVDLLNKHIVSSAEIIKKDKMLLPILMINGKTLESNKLISLQSMDKTIDVDKAYEKALSIIKKESFNYALFSYSTRMGTSSGQVINAIKTTIITETGVSVTFISMYELKGLIRKNMNILETVLYDMRENVLV